MSAPFAGTGRLVRLVARRDRLVLPLWLVGLGGTIVASAVAVPTIYDTPEKITGYADSVGASPVGSLMSGRQVGLDTLGGVVANEVSQVAQFGVCLMVMFLVVRHTRAEEEAGRTELVRSTVVGRHAATLTALLYGALAAALVGTITTASMLAVDLDPTGSVTYGAGLALLGLGYTVLTLLAAQLAASARGALGIAGGAIAVGYLVRGVGAMQDNGLVWASPFGWAQGMNAFGSERWWPAALLVVFAGAVLAAVVWTTAHRDAGSGLLQARPGPGRATAALGTPIGLVLRLQRGLLIGWAVGLTGLGLLYGAVIPTIPDLVASNPDIAEVIGADGDAEQALVDAFLNYVHLFMAVIATGFAVASVLRLRSEEESGRAEVVLTTGVGRTAWLVSNVAVTGVGVVVLCALMGLGLAVGYGLGLGEWDQVAAQVGAQLAYTPAVLVVAAVAVVLVGVAPRWARAAWAVVAFVFLQVLLGQTLRLPDWVSAVSPFWHLPGVPVESFDPVPAAVEVGVALVLVVVGVLAFSRRDVTTG